MLTFGTLFNPGTFEIHVCKWRENLPGSALVWWSDEGSKTATALKGWMRERENWKWLGWVFLSFCTEPNWPECMLTCPTPSVVFPVVSICLCQHIVEQTMSANHHRLTTVTPNFQKNFHIPALLLLVGWKLAGFYMFEEIFSLWFERH